MEKRKVVQKGHTSSVVMDTREGRPVITLDGDDIIIQQVAFPPGEKSYRVDKTIDKMYPMDVLLQMPRTRKQAVEQGETKYFTNKLCVHGHLTYRPVSSGLCAQCASIKAVQYIKGRRAGGDVLPWEKMGKEIKEILSTVPATIRNSNERSVTDRLDAARKGLIFYYDPSPCQNGHADKLRYTSSNACVVCGKEQQQEYRDRLNKKKVTVDNLHVMSNPTIVIDNE